MESNSFYHGYRDTSNLFTKLKDKIPNLWQRILPWHAWYSGNETSFSISAAERDMRKDTADVVVAHSLSCFSLVKASVNSSSKLILLNPAFNVCDAVVNMYNVYNRRTLTTLEALLTDTTLYAWLAWDQIKWNPEEFQQDLLDANWTQDNFAGMLSWMKDRCLILLNIEDEIINGEWVMNNFWDLVDITQFSSQQSKWKIKSHIPVLGNQEVGIINDFITT